MLKKLRTALAVISILAVTALFVDFTGDARHWWGWMARIQFMPAVLSASFITLAAIFVLTLIFGRLYCSVICPLGVFQDIVIRISTWLRPRKKRHNRFNYKKAATVCRISVLALFVLLVVLGLTDVIMASLAGLLEPYSAYGRMATAFAVPVWDAANNMLVDVPDSYTFYTVHRYTSSLIVIVAAVTFIAVVAFAAVAGRDYCNKICPVGTILGYLSRFSLLKPVIDTSKCNGCTKCARNCKASCIDARNHKIDYTRCVTCFDCINNCSQGAISYTYRRKREQDSAPDQKPKIDESRRSFITTAGIIGGALALKAAEKTTDGGLTPLKKKQSPVRATALVPPGALSLANLAEHCTGCQLCVSACPNNVLKPSTDFDSFMQPRMDFIRGFCRPECTACSDACPTGAIRPLDPLLKSAIKIGYAVVDPDLCISATRSISCGNCARHCPAEAIIMVESDGTGSNLRPAVDESRCIGCGSCEYHCPVGTVESTPGNRSAIHVEGIEVHHTI